MKVADNMTTDVHFVPCNMPDTNVDSSWRHLSNRSSKLYQEVIRRTAEKFEYKVKEMNWDEVQDVERRRRKLLPQSDMRGHRKILAHGDGTVIPVLVKSLLFWFSAALFVLIRGIISATDKAFPDVGFDEVKAIGGFLSFFLVFFTGQSYKRFLTLYSKSMSMEGRIFDVSVLVKSSGLSTPRALRILRYMNAAHLLGYVGLSATYTEENFLRHLNCKNRLLSEDEYNRILEVNPDAGGSCYRELVAWAAREVENAVTAKEIDRWQAIALTKQILKLRGSLGALFDYADQPFPFFYVHLIYLLSVSYLPLFTYVSAVSLGKDAHWSEELFSIIGVLVTCTFVVGMRALGQRLSDPYGGDVEDLSVMHYNNFTWRMSRRILNSAFPAAIDPELEERLAREAHEQEPIGRAWLHSQSAFSPASPHRHNGSRVNNNTDAVGGKSEESSDLSLEEEPIDKSIDPSGISVGAI
mmetsp:Transcript_26312/g.57099  ORF Transcript_26312/g.57099 Transcript_26312/m.57099 type:complete len:468 (-) Transcript_26312:78-1481(-)